MIYVSKKYAVFKNGSCMGIRKTESGAKRLLHKVLVSSSVREDLIEMYLNGYLIYQI